MKNVSAKKGSALLIVLGMLAFMVVSAVAFSMFMRQSRLPSSFLRQQLTSAQLVKAALAEAMVSIDEGIGNNPYPGVGNSTGRNNWRNRIYMRSGDISPTNTISTMPLEGLAYLPPSLINTVRYWARRSPTAMWNSLDYDAGRYAYTAINVSDYFDINRIHAGLMRDSSPSNRISLASVFMDDSGNFDTQQAEAFEDFIENASKDSYKTRLVSMADYNLALHQSGQSTGFESPFCKYFDGGSGNGVFYENVDTAKTKKQTFVTDSWYPDFSAMTNTTELVLSDDTTDAQPFLDVGDGLDPLLKIKSSGSEGLKELRQYLNLAELVAFKDYLDEDNIPTSLVFPTIERTPMLTGLQITPAEIKLKWAPPREEHETVGEKDMVYRTWSASGIDGRVSVGGSAVFPFKRTSALNDPSSYDVKILVRAFFAKGDATFAETTRLRGVSLRPTEKNWKKEPNIPKGYWSFLGETEISVNKERYTEEQALCNITTTTVDLDMDFTNPLDVFSIRYDQSDESSYTADTSHMDEMHVLPYRVTDNDEVKNVREFVTDNGETKLDLILLTYIRIVDGDGKTVDMFPATLDDDETYNGLSGQGNLAELVHAPTDEPIVPIRIPEIVTLAKEIFNPGYAPPVESKTGEPVALYCNDPRYNWAPEDWYKAEGGTVSASSWLSQVRSSMTSHGASDIFQFVSNRLYLQSLGEMQFLPMVRTSAGDHGEGSIDGSFFDESKYSGGEYRTGIGSLANNEYMWKTMWIDEFPEAIEGKSNKNNPFSAPIKDALNATGVSPYATPSMLMATLANTPYDWIIASENDEGRSLKAQAELSEGLKYCFCADSDEAPLEWEELNTIANNLSTKMRSTTNWEYDWDEWSDWRSGQFFGVDLQDFHDVDRKFLHSYWKGCFANRQQLFLIFVRAEPSVMGGASAGHTLGQLGARAVALVWREPVSSVENDNSNADDGASALPHRMRILFYHQFN